MHKSHQTRKEVCQQIHASVGAFLKHASDCKNDTGIVKPTISIRRFSVDLDVCYVCVCVCLQLFYTCICNHKVYVHCIELIIFEVIYLSLPVVCFHYVGVFVMHRHLIIYCGLLVNNCKYASFTYVQWVPKICVNMLF